MRIADEGREFLAKRAEEAGLTRTDCMRLLLRVPVEMLSGAEGPRRDVFVLVRTAVSRMAYLIRELGHHCNQAVYALNRLAFYAGGVA